MSTTRARIRRASQPPSPRCLDVDDDGGGGGGGVDVGGMGKSDFVTRYYNLLSTH